MQCLDGYGSAIATAAGVSTGHAAFGSSGAPPMVPVVVTVGNGDPVVTEAVVLGIGQAVPDHHDNDHV